MKTLPDLPRKLMATSIRKRLRKRKISQGNPDVLIPVNTALPLDILSMTEAEAALEMITPSQVIRRIVVRHYEQILKAKGVEL
jgi:hypothetical protein